MAKQTINGPMYDSQEFNTGDSGERGDSPKEVVDKLNAMMTELYDADALAPASVGAGLKYADVTITSAELLALFTTPISILAAPGAGFANVIEGISLYKAAGTAYAGVATGEDLMVSYTNAAGAQIGQVETTGFLDQATAQHRYMRAYGFVAAAPVSSITPVDNGAIVISLLVGNIITGTSDLKLRIFYRTVPTVF
jgi:hypothetical protein